MVDANTTYSAQELKELSESVPQVTDQLNTLISTMEKAHKSTISYADVIKQIPEGAVKAFNTTSDVLKNLQKNVEKYFDSWKQTFGVQTGDLTSFNNLLKQINSNLDPKSVMAFVFAIEPFFKVLPDNIRHLDKLDEGFKNVSKSSTTAKESFESFRPAFEKLFSMGRGQKFGKHIADGVSDIVGQIDKVNNMERAMFNMANSIGHLDFTGFGGSDPFHAFDAGSKRLENLTTQFVYSSIQIAKENKSGIQEAMNLTKQIGEGIPKALEQTITPMGHFASGLNYTSAAMKLAAGTGQDNAKMVEHLKTMYDKFGVSGTEAMERIAAFSDVHNQLKDITQQQAIKIITESAEKFKLLGDNTLAATNILKQFDLAMKGSKLSPEGISAVVSGMTDGIKGMNEAQKAFVSQQTGGPGGLAGAFKIDYALQQGKMDEVLKQTMQAMQKQFSGPVLTLKDAAQNPALSGEFYKQVEFIKSVSGLAKDNQSAYRVLEAMKSGLVDKLQAPKDDGRAVLGTKLEIGHNLQKIANTELQNLNRKAEELSLLSMLSNSQTYGGLIRDRTDMTPTRPNTIQVLGQQNRLNLADLEKMMNNTKNEISTLKNVVGEKLNPIKDLLLSYMGTKDPKAKETVQTSRAAAATAAQFGEMRKVKPIEGKSANELPSGYGEQPDKDPWADVSGAPPPPIAPTTAPRTTAALAPDTRKTKYNDDDDTEVLVRLAFEKPDGTKTPSIPIKPGGVTVTQVIIGNG